MTDLLRSAALAAIASARAARPPHWLPRVASGALPASAVPWQTDAERAALADEQARICRLRVQRAERSRPVRHVPTCTMVVRSVGGVRVTARLLTPLARVGHVVGPDRVWYTATAGGGEADGASCAEAVRRLGLIVPRGTWTDRRHTYHLFRDDWWGGAGAWRLRSDGTTVARWPTRPSRGDIARALVRARSRDHLPLARWPDGALVGVRFFAAGEDGALSSPVQRTEWDGPALTAESWSAASAVRGLAGIHACWPVRGGIAASRAAISEAYDMSSPQGRLVLAAVAAYGEYVAGADGWRAERVVVQTAYLPPDDPRGPRLAARYPDIDIVYLPLPETAHADR